MFFVREAYAAFFPMWSLNFQIADTCTHCVPIVFIKGISEVNQIVKEQPSTFVSPMLTKFEIKYHTKVCPLILYGMKTTLREL